MTYGITYAQRGRGFSEKRIFAYKGGGGSCQCTQYDYCNAPNNTSNTIDFSQKRLQFSICGKESNKENDRRPVDNTEGI